MSKKIITLTRNQLFNMVWKKPMQILAKEFHMSDVGLAKICRKHNIPRPPRGHWRKKETGNKYQTPKLPQPRNGIEPEIRIILDENHHNRLKSANDFKELIKQKVMAVNSSNGYKHAITSQTSNYLAKSKIDKTGILKHKAYPLDHIQVSQGSISRALHILDAILLSLELNRFTVKWKSLHSAIEITKDDIAISFKICEKISIDEIDNPSKVRQGNNQHTSYKPRYSYNPTGKLKFSLDKHYCASGIRSLWCDSKYKNIEYYVPDIIANCMLMVDAVTSHERITLANEMRSEVEREKYRAYERNKHIFNSKMEYILKIYEKWDKFNSFRNFIKELTSNVSAFHFENNIIDTHNELLKMAEHYAKRLNPFRDMESLFEDLKSKNNFSGGYF